MLEFKLNQLDIQVSEYKYPDTRIFEFKLFGYSNIQI